MNQRDRNLGSQDLLSKGTLARVFVSKLRNDNEAQCSATSRQFSHRQQDLMGHTNAAFDR
jgi:hypothetical protein